jgi:hypothetical protein
MNAKDVLIRIRSLFDRSGVDAATFANQILAASIKKTNTSTGTMGREGNAAFRLVHSAAAAARGSVEGLLGSIRALAESFPKLSKAAGPIAYIIAAGMALKRVFDTLTENRKKDEQALRTQQDQDEAGLITRLTTNYERLRDAIDKSTQARKAALDATNEQIAADQEAALAVLELEKQRALAKLAPDDEFGRRTVDADFAQRAAGVQSQGAVAKARAEDAYYARESAMQQGVANDEAKRLQKIEALRSGAADRRKQLLEEQEAAREKASNTRWNVVKGKWSETSQREAGDAAAAPYQASVDSNKAYLDQLDAEMRAAQNRRDAAIAASADAARRAKLARQSQSTLRTKNEAQTVAYGSERKDIAFDRDKDLSERQKKEQEERRKIQLEAVKPEAEADLERMRRGVSRDEKAMLEATAMEQAQRRSGSPQSRARRAADAEAARQRYAQSSTEYMRVESLIKRASTDDAALASLLSRYIEAKGRANAQIAAAIKRDAA